MVLLSSIIIGAVMPSSDALGCTLIVATRPPIGAQGDCAAGAGTADRHQPCLLGRGNTCLSRYHLCFFGAGRRYHALRRKYRSAMGTGASQARSRGSARALR